MLQARHAFQVMRAEAVLFDFSVPGEENGREPPTDSSLPFY